MLRFIKEHTSRTQYLIMALLLAVPYLALGSKVYASPMTSERVILGTSEPSTVTNHTFRFTLPTAGNVGSILFQYCDNSPYVDAPCDAPLGLNVSSSAIGTQLGVSGFSVDGSSDANNALITRVVGAVTSGTTATIQLNNITNPSVQRLSVYVRIKTYASSDGTGVVIDNGAVVFSTSGQLNTAGFVPPYLTFCAAITVSQDCSTVQGFNLDLGELGSGITSRGTSQFAATTNYPAGYIVFVSGTTMTSGNNIVIPLATKQPSATGQSQFGMNLVPNSSPSMGALKSGIGVATAASDYSTSNLFKFSSGDAIARSLKPSNPNVFTVSYIVNVPGSQPAGVYNTTLQYIATAQF